MSTLHADQIQIDGIYRTDISTGEVTVRVVKRHEPTDKSRNALFECVNLATGEPLPRFKRAGDLRR